MAYKSQEKKKELTPMKLKTKSLDVSINLHGAKSFEEYQELENKIFLEAEKRCN